MNTPDPKLMELADHIEMDHERELTPGTTFTQIRAMHTAMHSHDSYGDQYGHTHPDPTSLDLDEMRY